ADAAVLLEPGTSPWTPGTPLPEGPLAILDWGVRELDRPALVVDHQMPEAAPREDQVFVNGYGAVPEAPTAVLMRRIVTDAPAWLAAVGAVSDLGEDGFELPEAAEARRRAVRRLTSLVNAPRRVPGGPGRSALALLVESDGPRGAVRRRARRGDARPRPGDGRLARARRLRAPARGARRAARRAARFVGVRQAVGSVRDHGSRAPHPRHRSGELRQGGRRPRRRPRGGGARPAARGADGGRRRALPARAGRRRCGLRAARRA